MKSYKQTKNNSLYFKKFNFYDLILKIVLFSAAFIVFAIFISILFYIIFNGVFHITPKLFYNVSNGIQKGILPIIINTVYVEVLTLLISTPIGLAAAIYITQYAKSKKFKALVDFAIGVLSSVPTIILGLFSYTVFCVFLGFNPSILVGCLTLNFCVLPNLIKMSKEAILTVPKSYKQAALALGAENFKVVFGIILPSAIPGILTAIILTAGKIIGESAALLLTVGTAKKMPTSFLGHIFKSGKTLTLHLYFCAGNATSKESVETCFAIGVILIFLIFILNCLTKLVTLIFKK